MTEKENVDFNFVYSLLGIGKHLSYHIRAKAHAICMGILLLLMIAL